MSTTKPTNYWDYIRVDDLLGLQGGLDGDEGELTNDEVLFITVHQVYELWFKLILRELGSARDLFRGEHVAEQELSGAVHSLQRVVTVLRRCIDHFEVMETLTTRDYLGFRDKLMPASGFQSAQLRQIEILMGLEAGSRIPLGIEQDWMQALRSHDGSESSALRRVLAQIEDGPSLRVSIEEWLLRTPVDATRGEEGEAARARSLDGFVEGYLAAHEAESEGAEQIALQRTQGEEHIARLRERYAEERANMRRFLEPDEEQGGQRARQLRAAVLFITTYRELPLLAWPRQVLDGLIELEQVFTIFRQRHARMVERVIGRRTGTGGSAGVDYLDKTALTYRVFKVLWACRTAQVRRDSAPALADPGFYGFLQAKESAC